MINNGFKRPIKTEWTYLKYPYCAKCKRDLGKNDMIVDVDEMGNPTEFICKHCNGKIQYHKLDLYIE